MKTYQLCLLLKNVKTGEQWEQDILAADDDLEELSDVTDQIVELTEDHHPTDEDLGYDDDPGTDRGLL